MTATRALALLLAAAFPFCASSAAGLRADPVDCVTAVHLRVNAVTNPLAVDPSGAPALLSWWVAPAGGAAGAGTVQAAYRVRVFGGTVGGPLLWDSGVVASDDSVAVVYDGPAMAAGARAAWAVELWAAGAPAASCGNSTEDAWWEGGPGAGGWAPAASWIEVDSSEFFLLADHAAATLLRPSH
jgi:hypothetical protein